MKMHDSDRNLWSQDLAHIPFVMLPNPLRARSITTNYLEAKRTEFSLKLDED